MWSKLLALALGVGVARAAPTDLYCDDPDGPVCHLHLTIARRITMTGKFKEGGKDYPLRFNDDGTITFGTNAWYYSPYAAYLDAAGGGLSVAGPQTEHTEFTEETHPDLRPLLEDKNILFGNGNPLLEQITINNEFSAPTLRVNEHQLLAVTVFNHMSEQATTMHFHGQAQRKTWFYDGNPATQCPIHPGQSFTYRFKAEPAGVQWYHSHTGAQRKDGQFGIIIIRRDPERDPNYIVPVAMALHEMSAQSSGGYLHNGWYPAHSGSSQMNIIHRTWYKHDGQEINSAVYEAGGINGRGRDPAFLGQNGHKIPYETYVSGQCDSGTCDGEPMDIGLVNCGTDFGHEFTVEGHDLLVSESDGMRIKPVLVRALQVHVGESWLVRAVPHADTIALIEGTEEVQSFFFRMDTLGEYTWEHFPEEGERIHAGAMHNSERVNHYIPISDEKKTAKSAYALLAYSRNGNGPDHVANGVMDPPAWSNRDAGCEDGCKVLNCGHEQYYNRPGVSCMHLFELEADEGDEAAYLDYPSEELELAADHSVLLGFNIGPHINGYRFGGVVTPVGAVDGGSTPICREDQRGSFDWCVDIQAVEWMKKVRFIVSIESYPFSMGLGDPHVAHFHGYHLRVLAQGFQHQNTSTGLSSHESTELVRESITGPAGYPTQVRGHFPEGSPVFDRLNHKGIWKDTIMVAGGGWVYAEMDVTNDGYFLFHCHMAQHSHDGMTTLFRMGDYIPQPVGHPTCDNYFPDTSEAGFEELMTRPAVHWPFRDHTHTAGGAVIDRHGHISSAAMPDCCASHDGGEVKEPMYWKDNCHESSMAGEFEFEDAGNGDGYGYIKSTRYEDRCWSVINPGKSYKQQVFLKRCKGETRQQFKFAGGNIWLNHTGRKGQRYCVPFVEGARLETRRCFGFEGMLGDGTNRFHALTGGHSPGNHGH